MPVTVPSIFGREGVRQVIENPPHTRYNGWNLLTLNFAELVGGTHLRVASGDRKCIELGEDGTLIAVASILELLVYERSLTAGDARAVFKLNPLALLEFAHDFVLTYQTIVAHFDPIPDEAHFIIGLRSVTGATDGDIVLPPHGVNSLDWRWVEVGTDVHLPDSPSFDWSIRANLNAPAGEIAYRLIERVYPYFKNTTDVIPYLNADRTAVDPTTF